jgi:hypothetical protein
MRDYDESDEEFTEHFVADERRLYDKICEYDKRAARETNCTTDPEDPECGTWRLLLRSSQIGNAELANILSVTRPAKKLQVWLQMNNVNDEGLAALAGCQNLNALVLGKNFTDAGVPYLVGITSLRKLAFEKSKLTDLALASIAQMTHLEGLGLAGAKITDAGMPSLRSLVNLAGLDISGTKVTTASLDVLRDLPRLADLTWNRKKFPVEAEQELKRHRPGLCTWVYG